MKGESTVAVRKKDREEPDKGKDNAYEAAVREGRTNIDRQAAGAIVIRGQDGPWQQASQGKLKYYLIPSLYKGTVLQSWRVFTHEIRTQAGKHRHQGGVSIYVLEGKGYTVADGKRYDWGKGDLLTLPVKPGGVEHQHFNTNPDGPSRWMAFIYLPLSNYVALHLEQVEVSPEYNR